MLAQDDIGYIESKQDSCSPVGPIAICMFASHLTAHAGQAAQMTAGLQVKCNIMQSQT